MKYIKPNTTTSAEIERLTARVKELEEYEYMYKDLCK